jgi:hypothetical protein
VRINVRSYQVSLQQQSQGPGFADRMGPEHATHTELTRYSQIRANHPMVPQLPSFYFEVSVTHCVSERYVLICPSIKKFAQRLISISSSVLGIGVCEDFSPLVGMPGWNMRSWGYHSDDGRFYSESSRGRTYGQTYQTGDVIGCGGDIKRKDLFFTKNGVYLGEYQSYPTTNAMLTF